MMLQWVTFTLALISFTLWVAALVVGFGIIRAHRAQLRAIRGMAAMMGAASLTPPD